MDNSRPRACHWSACPPVHRPRHERHELWTIPGRVDLSQRDRNRRRSEPASPSYRTDRVVDSYPSRRAGRHRLSALFKMCPAFVRAIGAAGRRCACAGVKGAAATEIPRFWHGMMLIPNLPRRCSPTPFFCRFGTAGFAPSRPRRAPDRAKCRYV